jgi:hypothetical protein
VVGRREYTERYQKELQLEGGISMSYDINVYVKDINDSIINDWIEKLKDLNTISTIHPEFSFNDQSGFLPFQVLLKDCPNELINEQELLTGFELYVSDFILEEPKPSFWSRLLGKKNNETNILKEFSKELVFSISSQNSLEYRMAWYSAAIITKLTNGILYDPQVDKYYQPVTIIGYAKAIVKEYEDTLGTDDWIFHRFEGWVG